MPPLPVFAHLPMLVNEERKKLSKRRDPVAVESYRDQGYLPEAFVNYLGLLGWSPPGGEEIFTVDQMVEWFRLEDVNHAPAFFDVAKLTHINGEYIRAMPAEAFVEACRPWLDGDRAPWPVDRFDAAVFRADGPGGPGAGGRARRRSRTWSTSSSSTPRRSTPTPGRRRSRATSGASHPDRRDRRLRGLPATGPRRPPPPRWPWPRVSVASWARPRPPIRVAVTGRRVGPPLFESLEVLGPDRTLARLRAALARLAWAAPVRAVTAGSRPTGRDRPSS